MQTIKPAKNQLFCKPADNEKKTVSGILLTEKALDKPKTAEVINIGTDVKQFSPHDTIIYKSYSTTDVKLENVEYFLIEESDVLGTVVEVEEDIEEDIYVEPNSQ